jgi:hypothetical protein
MKPKETNLCLRSGWIEAHSTDEGSSAVVVPLERAGSRICDDGRDDDNRRAGLAGEVKLNRGMDYTSGAWSV